MDFGGLEIHILITF